jgi:glycosyltransferase involved in cell wall biosynthesis
MGGIGCAAVAPLNVLLLHNRYREPGGEERSVREITSLLRSRGHSVTVLERTSATAGRGRAARALLAGGQAPEGVARAVAEHAADVVHAHNIHPLFGARALTAARAAGARVVMHLHNYRLVCAIAIDYRDAAVCLRCRGRNTFPGVRLRCRGNLAEAVAYGAGLARQQRKIVEAVHAFVAPSEFAARRVADQGMIKAPIAVMPNFVADEAFAAAPPAGRGTHALFAGRLVEEKGADTAILAAARSRVPLAIAGSGPDTARLEQLAREHDAPVRFLGRIPPEQMGALRAHAAFVLVPSRWDEPCPYAVIEAMAAGLPVIASDRGGLPEMVGSENVLPDRDVERWAEAMRKLWEDDDERERSAAQALARARELFGEERFYSALMDVYEAA